MVRRLYTRVEGDGGQVDQRHCEPDGESSKDLFHSSHREIIDNHAIHA
jgi:hypothetical protein